MSITCQNVAGTKTLEARRCEDGLYLIRIALGNRIIATIELNRSEAELLCNDLLSYVNSGDPMQHAKPPKDTCEKQVDMRDITAAEIRAHWRQIVQYNVEILRALNHIENGYKNA